MIKSKYYEHTNYPKIYSETYWGSFLGKPSDTILENRNRFINDYEISTKYPSSNKTISELYYTLRNGRLSSHTDHIEIYRTVNRGVIVVNSPYGNDIPEDFPMTEIGQLYSENCKTYILRFDNLNHVRKIIGALK
jgi:hypothetical protein